MAPLVKAVQSAVGIDEALFVAALVLLTTGLWSVIGSAALVAPGAVILWVALPSRSPFVVRPGEHRVNRSTRER